MRKFQLLLPAMIGLLVAGCNDVPLSTKWKLRYYDLSAADVSKLRIALRLPEWVRATPEKTVLEATLLAQTADGQDSKRQIHLRRSLVPGDPAEIMLLTQEPASFAIYEVAPGDLGVAQEIQQKAQDSKREGRKGGGLKLERGVACRKGEAPQDGPIVIDAYIHADDETGWLPLLQHYDLRPSLQNEDVRQKLNELVPSC